MRNFNLRVCGQKKQLLYAYMTCVRIDENQEIINWATKQPWIILRQWNSWVWVVACRGGLAYKVTGKFPCALLTSTLFYVSILVNTLKENRQRKDNIAANEKIQKQLTPYYKTSTLDHPNAWEHEHARCSSQKNGVLLVVLLII